MNWMYSSEPYCPEYFRETLYKHALEHLEAARPEKNNELFLFSSYGKRLTIIGLFEGL